ncbi:MAG: glycosyltransferase family 4 protein [Fimbriimonadales bacterium]
MPLDPDEEGLKQRFESAGSEHTERPRTRILMIGPALDVKGGVSSVEIAIIENLSSEFEVDFLPSYTDTSRLRAGLMLLKAMAAIPFRAKMADIVHIHFSKGGSTLRKAILAKLVLLSRRPLVLHSHASSYAFYYELPGIAKAWVSSFLGSARRFVALSESWAEKYAALGVPKGRIVVMPNPVVTPKDVEQRQGRDTVTFVFLGEMGTRKGAFDLAEAFLRVSSERPQARLAMAGNGDVERVRHMVAGNGAATIYGWIDAAERDRLLRSADVFVLPSFDEGLPMSMLEALGHALPPIVTPVGGIPEVIVDGRNGLMVAPGKVDEIAAAMIRLIDNPEERAAIGKAARATGEQYDVSQYVLKMRDLYTGLLEE